MSAEADVVVTTDAPAVQWENVEGARVAYESELRAGGMLEPGEFVAIKSHRIAKRLEGDKWVYDVYVTFETKMGA